MTSAPEAKQRARSPLGPRLAWAGLALWLAVRPCLWGASPIDELVFLACAAVLVLPAGWCAWRLVREDGDDRLLGLAMSAALGFALLSLAYVALAWLSLERAIVAWPLVGGAGAWFVARRDRRRERGPWPAPALSARTQIALAAILLVVVERSQVVAASQWWRAFDTDILFHIGNATALHAGLPLRDPRVAGWPFHYHHLAYAWMNAVRELGGIALAEQLQRVGTSLVPLLVVLQTFHAGRVVGRSALAGLIAAALVALHIDFGAHANLVLGPRAYVLGFGSVFQGGLYYSPSEELLLASFATFVILLARWLDTGRRGALVALGLLAFAAAGTKGAGMPIVVIALGALAAIGCVRRRSWAKRAIVAALVAAACAAPYTLALAFAEPSFADAMLRWAPWQVLRASGSFATFARSLGFTRANAPLGVACLFAPVWLVGYFGLAGVAAVTWIVLRRSAFHALEFFLVFVALCGAFVGLGYAAPGFSQLFALYPGQLGLAMLAGAGLASPAYPRLWKAVAVGFLGGLLLSNVAVELWTLARNDLTAKPAEPPLCASYRAGLVWLRDHTPRDAVVLSRHRAMIASVHAERAGFIEVSGYTAEYYAAGWTERSGWQVWRQPADDAFTPRVELLDRFLAHPDRASLRSIQDAAGRDRPLYVIVDRLEIASSPELGPHYAIEQVGDARLESSEVGITLAFENDALRIYALSER